MFFLEYVEMTAPRLSVLVTFFQQDEYIKRNIESTIRSFNCSKFSFQIIICVQDPSCYALSLLNELTRKYENVTFFETQTNNNVIPLSNAGCNRYELLRRADTEYCMFLDGDDKVIEDYRTGGAAPYFFILDKERIIRKVIRGYGMGKTDKEITETIEELL